MGNTTIPAELVAINAIQGTLIADNAITAVHIGQNQVHSVQLAINSVTATQIADGTITSAKIQDGTIATADIADVQITTAKLADNSVTSAKIVNASIVSADIANNAILTQHIDDNQITADQIADNAVGLGQLASLSRGSIIYGDSAGNPAYLAAGTNGHVLTSDGTDISWTADTDLFLASSGGTITGALVVTGNANPALEISRGSANTTNVNLKYNTTLTGQLSAANGKFQISAAGSSTPLEFFTNGSERMRIDSTGGVGIGTDNPQAALHVAGGFNATAPTGNGVMMGYYLSSYGYIQLNGSSGGYIDFSTSGTDHKGRILYDNTHNYLRLDSNGSERLRIDSSGNVGIGTETPSEKLEVNGKIRLGGMRLANNDSGRIGLNRNPDDGSTTISGLQRFQINGPFSGGDYLDFQNYNSSGNYIGGFRVDGGAIRAEPLGISTPSYSFDNDTDTGMTRPTGNTLQLVTGGTERIRIDANGLVGIGNDDAGSMHAKANKLVVGTGSGEQGMSVFAGLSTGWYAFARAVGNNTDAYDGGISYNSDRDLKFHTNAGSARMTIDGQGNVGIGTESPSEKLTVAGAILASGALQDDRTSTGAMDFSSGATRFVSYGASGTGGEFEFRTAAGGASSTPRMKIHGSGCIDLGANTDRSLGTNITTTVTSGSAGSGFWMSTGNSSATSSKIISSTDGSVGDLLINQGSGVNGGSIRFSINDDEKMRINSNGKVGINKIDGTGMFNIQSNSEYTRLIELFGSGTSSAVASLRIGISGNNSQIAMIGGVSAGYAGLSYHYYYLIPQIQQSDNNGDLRLGAAGNRFHTVYSVNGVSTSDERVKEEIENLDVGLDFIKSLKPKKFKYKDKDSDGNYKDGKLDQKNGVKKWGLVAQDVKKALEDNSITEDIGLWSFEKGECNGEVIENQQQLQYQELISPLIKAIQEQQTIIDDLKSRIETLEG